MFFSGITPKILTFEYYAKNETYSEVNFICVYQVWSKSLRNAKMAATKFSFFVISTSDRGDFTRIIVIALFLFCLEIARNYLSSLFDSTFVPPKFQPGGSTAPLVTPVMTYIT